MSGAEFAQLFALAQASPGPNILVVSLIGWKVAGLAGAARDGLLAEGLTCDIVTGGGTGTFPYETGSGVYNEVQPGSYALMDVDYGKNEFDPIAPAFEPALYILTSVMSARGGMSTVPPAQRPGHRSATDASNATFAIMVVRSRGVSSSRRW